MKRFFLAGLVALGGAPMGCGFVINNAPLCDPGEVRACTCNTGGPGEQTCQSDGQDYLSCACNDPAASRDAGVPSVADAAAATPPLVHPLLPAAQRGRP